MLKGHCAPLNGGKNFQWIKKRGAYNGNHKRFPKVHKGPPVSADLWKVFTPIHTDYPFTDWIFTAKGKGKGWPPCRVAWKIRHNGKLDFRLLWSDTLSSSIPANIFCKNSISFLILALVNLFALFFLSSALFSLLSPFFGACPAAIFNPPHMHLMNTEIYCRRQQTIPPGGQIHMGEKEPRELPQKNAARSGAYDKTLCVSILTRSPCCRVLISLTRRRIIFIFVWYVHTIILYRFRRITWTTIIHNKGERIMWKVQGAGDL